MRNGFYENELGLTVTMTDEAAVEILAAEFDRVAGPGAWERAEYYDMAVEERQYLDAGELTALARQRAMDYLRTETEE